MNDILAPFNFKTVTTAANPTAVTKLDAFKKTQAAIANFTSITADNKFWMTNLEAQPAQETVTANGANKFTVSIGRACAKVRLSLGTGVVGSGGTLTNLKFKTKNNPNTMYLMPVYEGANYTGKQLLTPYYETNTTGTYIDGKNQVSFTTTGGVSYLTENSNATIKAGKASYLEVEGIWTPNQDQIVDENGNPTTVGLTGGTFWRIAKYDGDPANGGKIIGYKPYCYNASPKKESRLTRKPFSTKAASATTRFTFRIRTQAPTRNLSCATRSSATRSSTWLSPVSAAPVRTTPAAWFPIPTNP